MSQYLERFTIDCQTKGMSKHSIETYKSNVLEFLEHFPDPHEITMDQLISYIAILRSRQLSASTLKGYMSAVSSFYDFLVFNQEIQMNPIPAFKKRYLGRIRCHPEIRQLISIREMQDLFKAAPTYSIGS